MKEINNTKRKMKWNEGKKDNEKEYLNISY